MKTIILLAVLGLCQAGGYPMTADYAISTHGPDRSFSLVHKTDAIVAPVAKMMYAEPKMMIDASPKMIDARGFLANDWGWAGKSMAIASPYNAWAPKTMAIAHAPMAIAKEVAYGVAPTVSNTYVSRTFHNPAIAVAAKPMIAAPLMAEKALLARCDGCAIASPVVYGKSMLEEKLIHDKLVHDKLVENEFAKRAFAEKAWIENKMVDKLVMDKMVMDKAIAERAYLGASIGTPVAIAGKSLLEEKLIRDKLVENEFAKRAFAEKAWLENKFIEDKIIGDKVFAEKALLARSIAAPVTLADKWLGKAMVAAAPVALRHDAWLGDKVLASPFGTKTMLIKK